MRTLHIEEILLVLTAQGFILQMKRLENLNYRVQASHAYKAEWALTGIGKDLPEAVRKVWEKYLNLEPGIVDKNGTRIREGLYLNYLTKYKDSQTTINEWHCFPIIRLENILCIRNKQGAAMPVSLFLNREFYFSETEVK